MQKCSYEILQIGLFYSHLELLQGREQSFIGVKAERMVKDVLDLPERIIKLKKIKDMTMKELSILINNQTQSKYETFGYKTGRWKTRVRKSIIPGISNDDADLIHNIYDQLRRKMFNESLKTLEIEGDIKILKGKKNTDYIEVLVSDHKKWAESQYIYDTVCINGKEYEISGFGNWLRENAEGQSLKRMWLK